MADLVSFTARIEPELLALIDRTAAERHTNRSDALRHLLRLAAAAPPPPPAPPPRPSPAHPGAQVRWGDASAK